MPEKETTKENTATEPTAKQPPVAGQSLLVLLHCSLCTAGSTLILMHDPANLYGPMCRRGGGGGDQLCTALTLGIGVKSTK